MNKRKLAGLVVDALREEFESTLRSSKNTRAAGNDGESKAEGKYDTRSTEENYLADGLARQARAAAEAADAVEKMPLRDFGAADPIDLSALMKLSFPGETVWFFLAPAGGGIEVDLDGEMITVITPESPLGAQLMGLLAGKSTKAPKAKILEVR